jgi:hypothetical protein
MLSRIHLSEHYFQPLQVVWAFRTLDMFSIMFAIDHVVNVTLYFNVIRDGFLCNKITAMCELQTLPTLLFFWKTIVDTYHYYKNDFKR